MRKSGFSIYDIGNTGATQNSGVGQWRPLHTYPCKGRRRDPAEMTYFATESEQNPP